MTEDIYTEALIKGIFSPEQAKDIISILFLSKIQMHTDLQFSAWIKSSTPSPEDNRRKQELTESLGKLIKALDNMDVHSGKRVRLHCELHMSFVPDSPSVS